MTISTISAKRPVLTKICVGALWLLVWQGAYLAVGEDLLLSSPATVFRRLLELAGQFAFWGVVGETLGRILCGFLLGLVLGAGIGFLTGHIPLLRELVSLPMGVIKATPVASFVVLAYVWMNGEQISVFSAFLMVLPLVWSNVDEGVRTTDPALLEMAAAYRLPRASVFKNITLPAVLPYFLSAARVGLGFSWKAGVAGEVIAIPYRSIGTELYNAKVYLETADIFVWTAVVILMSVLLEKGMVWGVGAAARRLKWLTRGTDV